MKSDRIGGAPGSAANTPQGLTHSHDLSKEGLVPDHTDCIQCGQPNPKRTHPGGRPRKFCSQRCRSRYHNGYTGEASLTVEERLWARVDRGAPDACWHFRTAPSHMYGQLMDNYRLVLAHRVAYASANGDIPDGLFVRHKCDNPPCCNPAHLEIGTPADNSRDMTERGRQARLWKIFTTKMTDDQAIEVATRRRAGESSLSLAAEFGITRGYVNDLAAGRSIRTVLRERGV